MLYICVDDVLSFVYCFQTRAQLEKTKGTLEAENQDLANDLKQVQMAKQESERKRKQAETAVSELNIKLAELERIKSDQSEKVTKNQTELESLSSQLEVADTKNIQLSQKLSSLEAQLADAQVCAYISSPGFLIF